MSEEGTKETDRSCAEDTKELFWSEKHSGAGGGGPSSLTGSLAKHGTRDSRANGSLLFT